MAHPHLTPNQSLFQSQSSPNQSLFQSQSSPRLRTTRRTSQWLAQQL